MGHSDVVTASRQTFLQMPEMTEDDGSLLGLVVVVGCFVGSVEGVSVVGLTYVGRLMMHSTR